FLNEHTTERSDLVLENACGMRPSASQRSYQSGRSGHRLKEKKPEHPAMASRGELVAGRLVYSMAPSAPLPPQLGAGPDCPGNDRGSLAGARSIMGVHILAFLFALCWATGAAFAQTPATDSARRRIDLTVAQKQILYHSVSNTQKNNAAPTGFRA